VAVPTHRHKIAIVQSKGPIVAPDAFTSVGISSHDRRSRAVCFRVTLDIGRGARFQFRRDTARPTEQGNVRPQRIEHGRIWDIAIERDAEPLVCLTRGLDERGTRRQGQSLAVVPPGLEEEKLSRELEETSGCRRYRRHRSD